jgi:hypothetical protein
MKLTVYSISRRMIRVSIFQTLLSTTLANCSQRQCLLLRNYSIPDVHVDVWVQESGQFGREQSRECRWTTLRSLSLFRFDRVNPCKFRPASLFDRFQCPLKHY